MQHYFPTHVPTGPFKMPHLSYLASSQWTEVIQQSGSAYRLQFSRFPKVSDSCRFFGPSLPPGCLTVPRCHGNRGSKASGCDWYAAEVFPNLTPWLSLSLSRLSLRLPFRWFAMMSAADVFVSVCAAVTQRPALPAHCAHWHFSKLRLWHEGRGGADESSRGDRSAQTLPPTNAKTTTRVCPGICVWYEDVCVCMSSE